MDQSKINPIVEGEIVGTPTEADGTPQPALSPEPTIEEPQAKIPIEQGEIKEPVDAPNKPEQEKPITEPTTVETPPVAPETPQPTTEGATESATSDSAPTETPTNPETNQPQTIEPDQPAETSTGMFTIRSDETGDKVYLVKEDKRYWVKNTETLAKLGFYLGKEKKLPFSELLAYSEGEPIDLTIPGFIMPWDRSIEEQKNEPDKSSKVWA